MNPPPTPEATFEQAMDRLEEIVAQMEGDRMPLDEMVTSYEEGMRLLKVCRQRIESARRRVEAITADAEGRLTTTPFEPSAAAAEPVEEKSRPAAPARRKKPAEPEDDSDDIRLF